MAPSVRRPSGSRRNPRRLPVQPHAVGAHRPLDVLDPLLARELQCQAELALELVVGGTGDEHATGLAQLLQPCRDIDTVAEQIIPLDHHVAEIDADAEHDPSVGRHLGLTLGYALLDRHGARDGVDHRPELDDRPVAHQLDDAALVLGQERVDGRLAQPWYRGQRPHFVALDQPRIADDVGGQDRGEAPLHPLGNHVGNLRLPGSLPGVRRAPQRQEERHRAQNAVDGRVPDQLDCRPIEKPAVGAANSATVVKTTSTMAGG